MKSHLLLCTLITQFLISSTCQSYREMSSTTNVFIDSIFREISVPQVILTSMYGSAVEHEVIREWAMKPLTSRYPTRQLNFWDTVVKYTDKSGVVGCIDLDRSSALFATALEATRSSADDQLKVIENWRWISRDTYRAKFLLFFVTESDCCSNSKDSSIMTDLRYLLEFAWDVGLIDFTVYEITIHKPSDTHSTIDPFPDLFFTSTIHFYDPFARRYHRHPYTTTTSSLVFPYKLGNLLGYQLRLGFVHYPPYSDIRAYDNGDVVYDAAWGKLIEVIRDSLNITILPTVRALSGYGQLLPDGTANGMIGDVGLGKLDAIAFGAFMLYSDFNERIDRTRFLSMENVCPLVPLLPSVNPNLLNLSFVVSCLTVALLVFIIWLSSLMLRPEKPATWSPLNIIFLILGISTPGQPELLRERFLFGCLLVVSLFYSSNVTAQLTSINMDTTTYRAFDSFEDLDSSGLVPMLHPNMYNITFGFGEDVLQRLGRRSKTTPRYADDCPRQLLQSKNVTCVIEEVNAHLLVRSSSDQNGVARMKLGSPCYWSASRGYLLGKASPYTLPMNRVLARVTESGIDGRWWADYLYKFRRDKKLSAGEDEDDDKKDDVEVAKELKDSSYKSSFFFIMFGNFVSSCVFAWELYSHNKRLKVKRF